MLAKTVFLLILSQFSTAYVFNATIYCKESYNSKLIREKRWDEFRILRQVRLGMHYARHQSLAVAHQPFYDYADTEYVGHITIGTPEQQFSVILDTGSAVNMRTELHGPCDNKAYFLQNNSKTYSQNGRKFSIAYGTGSCKGFLGVDTVGLGDIGASNKLKVPSTTFGQATELSQFFTDVPVDGILGLAFSNIAADNVQPVFQRAVDLKLVKEPIFTVWLKSEGRLARNKEGGQITYGGIDNEHCDAKITYVPLTSKSYWQIAIEGTGVNGKKNLKNEEAISDTGTSLIVGPVDPLNKLIKVTKAVFDATYGLYTVDCKVKFTWSIWTQNTEFAISSDNLVLEMEPINCVLAYENTDFSGLGLQYILGDPFIREYCQIYDTTKGLLGLTKAHKK